MQQGVAKVTPDREPPASCKGSWFYDRNRDDYRSAMWHLMNERRGEDLHSPGHERGPTFCCLGDKYYGCTPGAGCDD